MSYTRKVKTFITTHNNHTQRALDITLQGVEHLLAHSDWDGLALLISKTEGRLGLRVREIVGACLTGVTVAADKNHHTGMRFKLNSPAPTEKLELLKQLVVNKETIYSAAVSSAIEGREVEKEKVFKTQVEVMQHLTKYAAQHGFSLVEAKLQDSKVTNDGQVPL